MATDINEFFTAFAHDSKFALHLPVLWTVTIDGVTESSINTVLDYAGEKWKAKTNPGAMTKSGNILVAQEVTLPNETSSFVPLVMENTGGFLPGYGLNSRAHFMDRGIAVNFLETQMDIEHNFFRPWIIAIGIKGLIEEGVSLKGSMTVKQFTNNGTFIKGFRFKKVFPVAVEPYTLNYENTDFKIKSVTFGCENYEQL